MRSNSVPRKSSSNNITHLGSKACECTTAGMLVHETREVERDKKNWVEKAEEKGESTRHKGQQEQQEVAHVLQKKINIIKIPRPQKYGRELNGD